MASANLLFMKVRGFSDGQSASTAKAVRLVKLPLFSRGVLKLRCFYQANEFEVVQFLESAFLPFIDDIMVA